MSTRQTRTVITDLARQSDYVKYGQYRAFFLEIDPELAQLVLDRYNTHNRKLKPRHRAFVRDMVEDNWQFNGDTICFSRDGVLRDGQNRLKAIAESGTTQLVLVVDGLPAEAQDTMDQGSKRTVGDVLHLSGEKDANVLAAVVANLVTLDKGLAWARSQSSTVAETKAFVEEHPEVRDALYIAQHARNVVSASPAAIGAAYYLCAQVNKAAADEFFLYRLIKRLGLTENDPALLLFDRFEKIRHTSVRLDADETIRLCLLAWNHYRTGSKISKLQGPKGGWTKDNFPEPK